VQNKPLLFGLLAGAIGLWLLLTWDPVAHEELDNDAMTETDPSPPPEAAPSTPAPAQQAHAEAPKPEPEQAPEEPPEEAPAAADPPSGIKLVHIPDQEIDVDNLPPPSPSGPLMELQKEFESAARDASSSQLEAKIEEAFKLQHVPPELLESAVCHGSTCRVRTRWTSQRAGGFTVAMTTIAVKLVSEEGGEPMFERNFALGQASERNSNGERTIDAYFRRRTGATKQ
jgi:hypothetical protein